MPRLTGAVIRAVVGAGAGAALALRAVLAHPHGVPRRIPVLQVGDFDEAPVSLREPALPEQVDSPAVHALCMRGREASPGGAAPWRGRTGAPGVEALAGAAVAGG